MTDHGRWMVAGALALAACGLVAGAARADRLVTKDGQAIETEGPWRVDGRLVVFERPDGTLASMRLSDVDVEASRRATEEAAKPRTAPDRAANRERPRKKPIARLTEKDLPPVGSPVEAPAETSDQDAAQSAPSSAAAGDRKPGGELRVLDWKEGSYNQSGLDFTGSIRNESQYTAVGVAVTGHLFDEKGKEAATATAVLTSSALLPGERADFRATFPGTFSYTKVSFDVNGQMLLNEPQEGAGNAGDQTGDQAGQPPASGTPDSPPDRDAGSGEGGSGG